MAKSKLSKVKIPNKVNQVNALKRLAPAGKPAVGLGQLKNMGSKAGY